MKHSGKIKQSSGGPVKTYCLYILVIFILAFSTSSASAVWEPKNFDYYKIILERKPFGEPPKVLAPPKEMVKPPHESFARHLKLTGLWEIDGIDVYAGIVDADSNQSYTLAVGDIIDDVGELVSVNYQNEAIVLRMGSENATLKLQSGDTEITSSSNAGRKLLGTARVPAHQSYIERRKARRAPIERPPPKKSKYTGEELKARLQEVQMEAIRTGAPPLPIPLTPEMDQKLVDEGVLPALN